MGRVVMHWSGWILVIRGAWVCLWLLSGFRPSVRLFVESLYQEQLINSSWEMREALSEEEQGGQDRGGAGGTPY